MIIQDKDYYVNSNSTFMLRQFSSKVFLEEGTDAAEAETAVEAIAKDVLANPVIEDFRVEIVNE